MEGESWDSERTRRDDVLEHSQCFLIMLKFTSDSASSWPWYPTYLKKKKKELPWGTIKWTGPFKTYHEMSLEKHIRWCYRQPGRHLHQLDDPRAPPRPSVLSEASLNTLFAYWRTSHTWEYTVEVSYFFQICQHCSFFFLNIEWHAAAAAPFNWGLPW